MTQASSHTNAPTEAARAQPQGAVQRCACGGAAGPTGECGVCQRRRAARGGTLQRQASGPVSGGDVPPVVHGPVVHSVLSTPGQPLDTATRAFMEPRFGQDFSRVRVHADAAAAASASAVQAHAYTVGNHVVFGTGRYQPHGIEGQRLMAHELTHVVQQSGRSTLQPSAELIDPSPTAERQARESADAITSGAPLPVMAAAPTAVMRDPAPAAQKEKSWGKQLLDQAALAQQELAIRSISAAAGPAGGVVEAMLRGMLEEYQAQANERAEQAWGKVKEAAASPFTFLAHYYWGLVKGIFSPLTGLFDLAKLGVRLSEMQAQLLGSAWKNREAVAAEGGKLSESLHSLGAKGKAAIQGFKDNPAQTVKALGGWFSTLSDEAKVKARGAGHDVMKSLLSTLDKPMPELAESAGEIVGALLINIVLLVFTAGIGDAIAQVATKLGELGAWLGKFGEAAAMIGKLVGEVAGLLGKVGGWIAKGEAMIAKAAEAVLKPLAPLLEELGNLVSGLRSFLRKVLGLADEAAASGAETAAAAAAKQIEGHAPAGVVPKAPTPPPAVKPGVPPVKPVEPPVNVIDPVPAPNLPPPGVKPSPPRTLKLVKPPPEALPPPSVTPQRPIQGVIKGEGLSTSGPAGKLKALPGGKGSVPVDTEAAEGVLAATGTDDVVGMAAPAVEGGEAVGAGNAADKVMSMGGRSPKKPTLTSASQGAARRPASAAESGASPPRNPGAVRSAEPPVRDVHVPPDRPPVTVEPRARGYAIEDAHMPSLQNEGYTKAPDYFKTIDAYKGGQSRLIREDGRIIEEIVRPDVVSVKSTSITNTERLTEKVTADLDVLRGRFEYTRGTTRISGAAERRLDLLFEEGADITPSTVRALEQLQRNAGSIRLNWWAYRQGSKIGAAEFIRRYL